MALADTGEAIGQVSSLLIERLNARTGFPVTVGHPGEYSGNDGVGGLNLFLYGAAFDASLRNVSLDRGQPAPLWLVLRYLVTAFHGSRNDTSDAHAVLGEGLRALQEHSFLQLTSELSNDIRAALKDNPEPLKITFDEASPDALAQLSRGTDDRYRFSMCFQVRPVLIAPAEPARYGLLVGVDYTGTAPTVIGRDGVRVPALPALGPHLERAEPATFEPGDEVTLVGTDLHLGKLHVALGDAQLPVLEQQPNRLRFRAEASPDSRPLQPGRNALSVVQERPDGRLRASNLLEAHLRPVLTDATPLNVRHDNEGLEGTLQLRGPLLGSYEDDTYVALLDDSRVVALLDRPEADAQEGSRSFVLTSEHAVPPGTYRLVLRVNGAQALHSPAITLLPP